MIGKMKKQSRFMSVISVITAAAVIYISMHANGAMVNKLLDDDYKSEVYSGNTLISFDNQPFIENGELYLPLRELLNKFGVSNENILWIDGGKINLRNLQADNYGIDANIYVDIAINEYACIIRYAKESEKSNYTDMVIRPNKESGLKNPPIIKDAVTFVPYEFLVKLNSETDALNGLAVAITSDQWDGKVLKDQLKNAIVWANALKTRDGKPRYEMMDEEMKKLFASEQISRSGEPWNFNIGVSSPWVFDYDIELVDNIANIVYHTTDSIPEQYVQRETIVFSKEGNNLIVTDAKYKFEEWGRTNYFLSTPEAALKAYRNALLESNYRAILSLMHTVSFDDNGEDIWDTVKISEVSVISQEMGESKAIYQLELNVVENGNSAFEKGKCGRYLILTKAEHGWFVDALVSGL